MKEEEGAAEIQKKRKERSSGPTSAISVVVEWHRAEKLPGQGETQLSIFPLYTVPHNSVWHLDW
jgi:hypothetical protein